MIRLSAISSDLVNRLCSASSDEQRAVLVAACEFALAQSALVDPAVDRAMTNLTASGSLDATDKAQLEALTERFDNSYFELEQTAHDGTQGASGSLVLFSKARAAAALAAAAHDDLFEAVTEALYEAAATTDNSDALFEQAKSLLHMT